MHRSPRLTLSSQGPRLPPAPHCMGLFPGVETGSRRSLETLATAAARANGRTSGEWEPLGCILTLHRPCGLWATNYWQMLCTSLCTLIRMLSWDKNFQPILFSLPLSSPLLSTTVLFDSPCNCFSHSLIWSFCKWGLKAHVFKWVPFPLASTQNR